MLTQPEVPVIGSVVSFHRSHIIQQCELAGISTYLQRPVAGEQQWAAHRRHRIRDNTFLLKPRMIAIAIVYGKVDIFTIEVRKLYVRGKSDIGIGIPLLAGARAISWQPTAEREAVDAFCRNWDYNASTTWEKDANPARPPAAASHQRMPTQAHDAVDRTTPHRSIF